MAGDWIKIEHATPDKPEVYAMSHTLSLDPDEIVGKLIRLWIWCDQQLEDCNGASVTSGVTKTVIDRITRVTGFAQAMGDAGWLVLNGDSVEIPNFWYHNGQTAKNRGLTNRRVARSRSKSNANCNGASVTSQLQKALPEKRREKKNNSNPQHSDEEWLAALEQNPAFSHVNIQSELQRAQTWIQKQNGRRAFTRKFFEKWLSNAEKPVTLQIKELPPSQRY